ncbi:hypothetical protein G9C98_005173 [Cotesia typhae]|uniref:CAP-Gly domain-containing protein n=1 Tax=Cotesia typhae TaxID=2053667 RepID=A0A8J5RBG0_9HYME|nr:hypothetical protein G9C98_005173 [Cotesia typhae]
MAEYIVVTSDFINVSITSSGQKNCIERRFQKGITIDDFKGKLELLTGGNRSTMQLEVTDNFIRLDDDLANVPKFEISDDDYSKRPDTVKAFLAKNKLGKYNEEEMKQKEADKKREEESEIEWTKNFNPGDRCEISVPSQPKRRGTIMYVGKTDFKEGLWVGVKYDEPLGKNDGSVNGKRYFECPPKYGGFVKPLYVKKGDFPEEDYDLDEEL